MAAFDFARSGTVVPVGGRADIAIVAPSDIATIAEAWAMLAARAACTNVFIHPEFAIPVIDHFGKGEIAAALVPSGTAVPAGLALFVRTRLGRIAPAIRLIDHKYAPFGEPLVDDGDVEGTLTRLVDGLAPGDSGLTLILPAMDTDGANAAAVRAIAARSGRPLMLLDDHRRAMLARGPALLDLRARLSHGKRKDLARQLRRLGDAGPVAFTSDVEPDVVCARFEEFLALEQAGWKGRKGTALASSAATAAFSRDAVFNLAEARKMRIDTLRVGAHPVAILISFVAGAVAYTWKIAYDEAYARLSPGVQLMLEAPTHLFRDPAVQFVDSCATADHPMINGLWPDRRGIATFVLGPPGGSALFSIGVAAARAEIATRANVRQLRDRFG